jgi:CubicO group peptidase (beta-lactamase class C family)
MNLAKKRLLCVLCLASLLLLLVASARAAIESETEAPASPEVTSAMQPYLDSYKLAGIVALIADKTGKVHYKNILGYADVEARKPMREDNLFWIASMTKMFAGASIMMLVDEGKVSLDDPVTRFIPSCSNLWFAASPSGTCSVTRAAFPARPSFNRSPARTVPR